MDLRDPGESAEGAVDAPPGTEAETVVDRLASSPAAALVICAVG